MAHVVLSSPSEGPSSCHYHWKLAAVSERIPTQSITASTSLFPHPVPSTPSSQIRDCQCPILVLLQRYQDKQIQTSTSHFRERHRNRAIHSTETHVRVSCTLILCVCVCCATNHDQGNVYYPHPFCSFILVNMTEEELTQVVVGDDSDMCKTDSAADGVPPIEHPSIVERSFMSTVIVEMERKDMLTRDCWTLVSFSPSVL